MRSPMALGLEAMVANLNDALEHHTVELSFHQGRRIISAEVLSVSQVADKSIAVRHQGGSVMVQGVCRLEEWPADGKTLRTYALQARVQPSIACFYVHARPLDADVEAVPVESPLAPALIAP